MSLVFTPSCRVRRHDETFRTHAYMQYNPILPSSACREKLLLLVKVFFTFEAKCLFLSQNVYFWVKMFIFESKCLFLSQNVYFWVKMFIFESKCLFLSQNVYFWVKNLHLYSTSIPAYMYTDLNSSERPHCEPHCNFFFRHPSPFLASNFIF